MKKIIFENEHIKSTFFADKYFILNTWTGNRKLHTEDFKEAMMEVANEALNLEVKGILVDTRNFNLTINPETQKWYDDKIVPKHLEAGIQKMAFLLPEEIFTQVSIEQTMDEDNAKAQETQYFDTYEEAESWLINK